MNVTVQSVSISGITPPAGAQGSTVPVVISGYGFGAAPQVTVGSAIQVSGATVNGSGDTINANFVVASNAIAGDQTVTVYNTDSGGDSGSCTPPSCPNATYDWTITQVPSYLTVVSDSGAVTPACPAPMVAIADARSMTMQAVDATGDPLTTNATIQESWAPANPTSSCAGYSAGAPSACQATGAFAGEGVGQFTDGMSVATAPGSNPPTFCFPAGTAKLPSGCGFSLTSTWSACGSSGSNQLWVSPRVTHSNSITVDGNSSKWASGTKCSTAGC